MYHSLLSRVQCAESEIFVSETARERAEGAARKSILENNQGKVLERLKQIETAFPD